MITSDTASSWKMIGISKSLVESACVRFSAIIVQYFLNSCIVSRSVLLFHHEWLCEYLALLLFESNQNIRIYFSNSFGVTTWIDTVVASIFLYTTVWQLIVLASWKAMATQANLLGYFGKSITRKRKCQSHITAFLTKSDGKVDDGVIYLGSK